MTDDELNAAIEEARQMASAEQKLATLERLRESVLSERRVLRVLTVVAILVGMIGIGLSVRSFDLAHDANRAIDVMEQSRAEARITSCEQANEQQTRSRNGNKAQVREVFRSLTSDDELTPDEQASLDRLFASHDEVIDDAFPMRRCDPAGIEAYFDDDDTTDPYVKEVG